MRRLDRTWLTTHLEEVLRTLLQSNPQNRWQKHLVEYDLDAVPLQSLQIYSDDSVSILSENDSPDVPFRFSVNPYRGCAHGCAYCYARPTHEYLGFGSGSDFERKIVIKQRAAEPLRAAFERRNWAGDCIMFSGNTDCYQPLEAQLELTRQCLQVCLEYRNPVHVITKSSLVERDLDLLQNLHEQAGIGVTISVTLDTLRQVALTVAPEFTNWCLFVPFPEPTVGNFHRRSRAD